MMHGNEEIIPTFVWYYYVCRREVWLMSHQVNPFEGDSNMEIGRILHENSYPGSKKEISLPGMKIDLIRNEEGETVVGEMKKSSRHIISAKMQLAYYLYRLRESGISVKGKLYFPKERKAIEVVLDDSLVGDLEKALGEIRAIMSQETPPEPRKIPFCRRCAYREYCWS